MNKRYKREETGWPIRSSISTHLFGLLFFLPKLPPGYNCLSTDLLFVLDSANKKSICTSEARKISRKNTFPHNDVTSRSRHKKFKKQSSIPRTTEVKTMFLNLCIWTSNWVHESQPNWILTSKISEWEQKCRLVTYLEKAVEDLIYKSLRVRIPPGCKRLIF